MRQHGSTRARGSGRDEPGRGAADDRRRARDRAALTRNAATSSHRSAARGAADGASTRDIEEWEASDRADRRFRPGVALLVIAAVAALGWLGRGGVTVSEPEPERFTIERSSEPLDIAQVSGDTPASRRARRALQALPLIPLGWAQMPDAPIEAVSHSPVLATRTGVAVVGALDDRLTVALADLRSVGAGISRERRQDAVWTTLPSSPLQARAGAYLGQPGPETLVVWGGAAGPMGDGDLLHDGAVVDTVSGEWTPLPDLPEPLSPRTAGWVAGRLVVVGAGDAGQPTGYFWSPDSGQWQPVEPPPVSGIQTIAGVTVGDRLLVYGVSDGLGVLRSEVFTLAYDVASGEWTSFEHVPLQTPHDAVVTPMAADELFMWGRPTTTSVNSQPDGLTLSSASGAWGQISPAGIAAEDGGPTVMLRPRHLSAAWTGQSVVIAGDPDMHMLAYTPSVDEWVALARPPESIQGRITYASGHIVRWGGLVDGRPQPQLWIFPGSSAGGGQPTPSSG